MISGPVFPRTREGLRELVEQHLCEIEFGLQRVERDLEFEPGCAADLLAKDAAGRPALVFVVAGDPPGELLTRVLMARAWMQSGAAVLANMVASGGLNCELAPRFIAVGYEIHSDLVRLLSECAPGALELYQLRVVRIGGRIRVGMIPLCGVDATADEGPYRVPSGVSSATAKTLCARFLELMRRVESDFRIVGDRYSRRFHHDGVLLTELSVLDGDVRVRIPKHAPSGTPSSADAREQVLELRAVEDCHEAVDRVMRSYLALLAANPRSNADSSAVVHHCDQAPRTVSLADIREAMGASRLSPEEYSLLGDFGSDDGG
jgi:hypothetical protein